MDIYPRTRRELNFKKKLILFGINPWYCLNLKCNTFLITAIHLPFLNFAAWIWGVQLFNACILDNWNGKDHLLVLALSRYLLTDVLFLYCNYVKIYKIYKFRSLLRKLLKRIYFLCIDAFELKTLNNQYISAIKFTQD